MECIPFLIRPQIRQLKIVSWNVNGARTKLEKSTVYNFLYQFDMIGLNEVKTDLPVSLPGYVSYKSIASGGTHRGGTVLLLRRSLQSGVISVDTGMEGQVWVRLSYAPDILFGFVYIPPSDSPYFNPVLISAIQEKIKTANFNTEFVILGDMNARFGASIRDWIACVDVPDIHSYTYPVINDTVRVPNDNALAISSLCVELKLIIINNLKIFDQHFRSELTYRSGAEWKSELDVCISSPKLIKHLSNFKVWKDISLPSDHAPISVTLYPSTSDVSSLYSRAGYLGDHAIMYTKNSNTLIKRPIKFNQINLESFCNNLVRLDLPVLDHYNIDGYVNSVSNILYECSQNSQTRYNVSNNNDNSLERWDRLLNDNDDARVWQAIDWKGQYQENNDNRICPNDEQFKDFYEELLNHTRVAEDPIDLNDYNVTIPVLDGEILENEVRTQIHKLKSGKSGGPDGLCPGLFKVLPVQWVMMFISLFNVIFSTARYPTPWQLARLVTIFKRGDRVLPVNYRGINIINVIAKLYDMVLCSRLMQWFSPYREQAGGQPKRGCIEHVVTLRLLLDLAKRKKLPLFITFVDFSQAYDRVPRNTLFCMLKRLGCGAVMLAALIAMYHATRSIIGTAVITATVGVRQGSPTSCFLFVLFVNDLIKLIKDNCGLDGFLMWLHVLVLMDDTVILSTSRNGMMNKLGFLNQFCQNNGMKVNMSKTKFFAINAGMIEREPFRVGDLTVSWCDRYVYLGSVFTSDGLVSSAIAAHAQAKMCHILKFISFVNKNNDVSFFVKKKLFNAALMSTILYGCESWINGDLKPIVKLYNWGIKQLLGVRKSTCNDLCYLEVGMPSLKAIVMDKQRIFFLNMWRDRNEMVDDPWVHVVKLTLECNTPTSRYISNLISIEKDDIKEDFQYLKQAVIDSNSSRRQTYKVLNPELSVHDVYIKKINVNDIHRASFTRLRLSAHNLAIETGRWNRRGRGRLPVEERLCPCGQIQTELHVVESCPITHDVRTNYNINSFQQILVKDIQTTVKIAHSILNCYS